MTVAILCAGIAVALFAYTVLDLTLSEERHVHDRMSHLSSYEGSQAVAAEPMLAPFSERVLGPVLQRLLGFARALAPSSYLASLDRRLVLAGSPRGMDGSRLFTVEAFVGGVVSLVVVVGRLMAGQSVLSAVVTGVAAGLAAFIMPTLWVSMKASKRQERIRRDMPDMLDMLLISVEAGLGFDAAVAKIVRRAPGPLGEEFGRMLRDGQAGLSRREALKRLASRNDVAELNAFIMAMVQADVFGVSIANILRAQAREMRIKRRQRAQEMAQKAPAKMVFPLILCVLPATLIVLAGPAVLAIARAFGGIQG